MIIIQSKRSLYKKICSLLQYFSFITPDYFNYRHKKTKLLAIAFFFFFYLTYVYM